MSPFNQIDRILYSGLVLLAFLFCFNILNHISEYLFLILVILGLLKICCEQSLTHIPTSLDLPLIIFLGWILLTLPFALDPSYSFVEWRKALPRFLMFWFVLHVVRHESQVKAILHAFVIGLGILCLIEVVDFFLVGGNAWSMDIRAGSFFGAHQWLSNFLIIGGPFLWLSWASQEYVWEKIVHGLVVAVYPFAVFLVHTRSVWLVVLVQLGLFILYRITGKFFLSVGVILISITALFVILNISSEFQRTLSTNDFSNTTTLNLRFNTWKIAIQDIQQSPIVGVGFGKHTFRILHPDLPQVIHKHIHNMFLGAAFQLGVPGFIFFLVVFLKTLAACGSWLSDSRGHESFQSQLALAIGLMTVGVIVRNSFDDMFHGAVVYLFVLFVALGFCLNRGQVEVWSWSRSEGR